MILSMDIITVKHTIRILRSSVKAKYKLNTNAKRNAIKKLYSVWKRKMTLQAI